MKKLLKEEKTVFKPVSRNYKIVLFCLILNSFAFPQIPINGFCKLSKFQIPADYTKIFTFNYNKDSYTDLLLFNPLKKETTLLTGEPNLKFTELKKIDFPFEPNAFKPVYDSLNQIIHYAFTSRKSRLAGIMNFDETGSPTVLHSIKLNYFPDGIDVIDLDYDRTQYYLLSGRSFDGLSLLKLQNGKLQEQKIISAYSYSSAYFLHLNNDEVYDIIAYSVLDKSFHFLINNGRNEYTIQRKINLNNQLISFQIFDINGDSFTDIICQENKFIQIFYGDPLYLFEKSVLITTEFPTENISIADYNHDGLFDILTISKFSNTLSVFYSKDGDSFYNEVKYLTAVNLASVSPFFSRFTYGAVYITSNGEMGIISELKSFGEDITLIPSINPENLLVSDFDENGIKDFAFIESNLKQIIFILRNNRGIPSVYYPVKLFSESDKIVVFSKSKEEKIIYCYKLESKHLEILYINFSHYTFSREYIYANGPIVDLKIVDSQQPKPEIHILYEELGKLNYGLYQFSSINYQFIKYPAISQSWLDAKIVNANKIFYWTKNKDGYELTEKEFGTKSTEKEILYKLASGKTEKIFTIDKSLSNNFFIYSSVIIEPGKIRILNFDKNLTVFSKKDSENLFIVDKVNHLAFDNDNLLYLYSQYSKNLYRTIINKVYNRIGISKIFGSLNIKNFIVDKLDTRNKNLIYIDSAEKLIKVKKID